MEKIATENLFLLEFLVDNVQIDPKCDCASGEGERCVSFQFLDNAPLDSGKSCLFALSPDQANAALQQFDVFVTIYKKMPVGWLPEKVEVGEALISISNVFTELINSVEESDGTTPTAKTLKDLFDVNTANGEVVGKIGVYIRMSCFGKLIVTQFQMNLEDKSVLFKDKEGKSLYRYKKAGKGAKGGGKGQQDACTPRATAALQQPSLGVATGRSSRSNPCPASPAMMCPASPGMNPGSFGMNLASPVMIQPPMGGNSCPVTPCLVDQTLLNQYQYGAQAKPPCQECGARHDAPCLQQMQGRGMEMGQTPCQECGARHDAPCLPMGMTPCIECGNIPNAPCMPPFGQGFPPPCTSSGNAGRTPCVECAGLPNAPCNVSEPEGNYQEIGATMGGNTLTIRVHKDKNKVEQVDPYAASEASSDTGCCCAPGQVGKKKKKKQERVVDMRPGMHNNNQDLPFSFKMGKSDNTGNNVTVNPPVATAPDGTKFTEFSDPNKEIFVLRVGKKSEGVDRKQNLELELCTPRGKAL
ncbi:hypothetical protein NQ315_006419 [Exocentrus adspersus]|uniref:Uncharacterized protein n=1 Tax=Exocentrus adspersus TaxID=1586481 RepID=A0AAV8W0K1_9CUCU|nr:hypothetical protein NQ315_006419 [Exocentrus adspersus]